VSCENPSRLKVYAKGEEAIDSVIDALRSSGGEDSFYQKC